MGGCRRVYYEGLLHEDEGVEALMWLYDEFGTTCPCKIGRWYNDFRTSNWEYLEDFRTEIKCLEGILKKMEEIFND